MSPPLHLRWPNRSLLAASPLILLLLLFLPWSCTGVGAGGNENDNGATLGQAYVDIADDIERANECGDINPTVTAADVRAFLEEEFEQNDGSQSFEEFVLDQAEFFRERADVQCGVTQDENGNDNENAS
jgi:hypothetical protein